jgi:hypothetical protein
MTSATASRRHILANAAVEAAGYDRAAGVNARVAPVRPGSRGCAARAARTCADTAQCITTTAPRGGGRPTIARITAIDLNGKIDCGN